MLFVGADGPGNIESAVSYAYRIFTCAADEGVDKPHLCGPILTKQLFISRNKELIRF